MYRAEYASLRSHQLFELGIRRIQSWYVQYTYMYTDGLITGIGFTRAYVCATSKFDSTGPTIIELLYYWLASGMRMPGTLQLPEVGLEPPVDAYEWPCRAIDLLPFHSAAIQRLLEME